MGCTKVSAGCKNCYMFRDQERFGKNPTEIRRSKTTFNDPLKWKEPRKIFVCSWSDFFHEQVPHDWRWMAWHVIRSCPQHTFMILTKRPHLIKAYLPSDWFYLNDNITNYGWPNVWIGTSVENQDYINRVSHFYDIRAVINFLSAEPLLGPLDLSEHMGFIDWVITGGESGPDARPMNLDWVRDIRDQCFDSGVAFFHKQNGGTKRINKVWGGRLLDGRTWDEFPDA